MSTAPRHIVKQMRALLVVLLACCPVATAQQAEPATPRSIIDLQADRVTETVAIAGNGTDPGAITLINLNPNINVWYVLSVRWPGDKAESRYHLENTDGERYRMHPDKERPGVLLIEDGAQTKPCDAFRFENREQLLAATHSSAAFVSLCDDKVILRNRIDGRYRNSNWMTKILPDGTWGGEPLVSFVKEKIYKEKFADGASTDVAVGPPSGINVPTPARVTEKALNRTVGPYDLGLSAVTEKGGKMLAGRWYESKTQDGVFVSAMQARHISDDIMASFPESVNPLDKGELDALNYFIAFDLNEFGFDYEIGTDHPNVKWSSRTPQAMRDANSAGPDGFGDWAPLVPEGMVPPHLADEVIATFTAGFKREHSVFQQGPWSKMHRGSHYGVIENGVIFSSMIPGLATLVTMKDGSIDYRVWSEADTLAVAKFKHARQNGMPLIEPDEKTGEPTPGKLVTQHMVGNWGDSSAGDPRSIRAGSCFQETPAGRFLIFGMFPVARPSVLVRVFQAFGCKFAMNMDMNAPMHTYAAVYGKRGKSVSAEHIYKPMATVDRIVGKWVLPRFLGFNDDRDFFYVTRKKR